MDGLSSFAKAVGVSLQKFRSYIEYSDTYYGQTCNSAITCGDSKNEKNTFILASFTDGYCQLAGYADTTNTLPIRVIDVVPDTATGPASVSTTTYYEFLVKFNLHQYTDTTGI
mgnify:CR=1 FL=1